jgi:hypothetical protein
MLSALVGLGFVAIVMVMSRAEAAPANADQLEAVSESPFGVCGPWPGIQEAGIKWCRGGAGATPFVNWPEIEKSPGVWNWTAADGELAHLDDPMKLSLLPIFGYTPKWASRAPEDHDFQFCPPRDVALLSRFVRQCVTRYKHRVKVWEVWNEPNIEFFHGSIAEYAELVKAAAVAAKQVDPECRTTMGCAGVDLAFLERLYEFGCGPYFDVMAVHPYQWGRQLNDGFNVDRLQACRQLMDRHGDRHKEIWATEFGWSIAEGVSAQEQADLAVQAMVTFLSVRERLKVEKAFWFCVKDWGHPDFGLLDEAGKPKPAFRAYQALTTELASARYRGPWKTATGVRGHVFDRAGQPVLVLWNPSPDGKTRIELKTSAPKLSLRAVSNQVVEVTAAGGKAAIDVSHAPVFLSGLKISELEPLPSLPPVASPAPKTRPRVPDVWISVLPPSTTARPYLVLSTGNELPLRIHNDGSQAVHGRLELQLTHENRVLAAGQVSFDSTQGTAQTVVWRATLPAGKELVGQLATLRVRGLAGQEPLAPIDLPVRLVGSKAIEFTANSWIERQYLHKAEKTGASDSLRFGDEFGYRFDLGNARAARLRIDAGANGGKPWKLLVSKDDQQYIVEGSGVSWPRWQTVSLDKYLAGAGKSSIVYVKIQGKECQVREVLLDTEGR